MRHNNKYNVNNKNKNDIKEKLIEKYLKLLNTDGQYFVYENGVGIYCIDSKIMIYTEYDLDNMVEKEIHKNDAHVPSVLEHNILKINKLVETWKVIEVEATSLFSDDENYLPGYCYIDVDGLRGHRFYDYIEYSSLRQFGCDDYKFSEHSIVILSLILSDINTGLWSVDMRFSNVLTLLNYMKPLLNIDLVEEVHKHRKPEDDVMYKLPDINDLSEEDD